jgi:transcriptional regulator with PAS, ATPase and Fis domain
MSKRELKKYLNQLNKEQLKEQIEDLYNRFKEVKAYYDFSFNPQEKKLVEECKQKISKEYFPIAGRKAKMRRSVAQKYIRHFVQLGVDSMMIADIMLFNIEIAQILSAEREIKQEAFYKSMLKSFEDAIQFMNEQGILASFSGRLNRIAGIAEEQNWFNMKLFKKALERKII